MKFTWLSNAPFASTGYGNQTKLFLPRLKALGHEPAIIAFYGLEGGVLHVDGIPVFPKGYHGYGMDVASPHTKYYGAQVLFSLIDAWVYDPNVMQRDGVKWIPWFPVDMEPLPKPVKDAVAGAYRRIVFSRFGERMVNDAGLDCYYVPHGIDTKLFRPLDRVEARKRLGLRDDVFLVGMVAANKGYPSRKALFENVGAFAQLHRKHPDTLLYMHTQPGRTGENKFEVNLVQYCESVGLTVGKDVMFANPYQLHLGFPEQAMVDLYNSFDVHLLASMGEGFGIPQVEAQACGCPVVSSGWTACDELTFSGWKVDKRDAVPFYTPLGAYQYLPKISAIADKLEAAYRMAGNTDYRKRARDGALAYDADKVTEKYWKPVLAEIEQDVEAWQLA